MCRDFIIKGGWGPVSSLVDIKNTFAYALSTICQALCTIFIYVILFKQICIYRWITERWINLPKVTDIEISKASIGVRSLQIPSTTLFLPLHHIAPLKHFCQQAAISQRWSHVILSIYPTSISFLWVFKDGNKKCREKKCLFKNYITVKKWNRFRYRFRVSGNLY